LTVKWFGFQYAVDSSSTRVGSDVGWYYSKMLE